MLRRHIVLLSKTKIPIFRINSPAIGKNFYSSSSSKQKIFSFYKNVSLFEIRRGFKLLHLTILKISKTP